MRRNERCVLTVKEACDHDSEGESELARATMIRDIVLRFMRKHARWDRLANGPEVLKYQDPAFLIIVSIQEEVSRELRKRFGLGLRSQGLFCLDIWETGKGKVLYLTWNSIGAPPEIITFRRGDWEEVFIPGRPRSWSPCQLGYEFAAQVRRRRREAKIRD
jgi:hypothetical protein